MTDSSFFSFRAVIARLGVVACAVAGASVPVFATALDLDSVAAVSGAWELRMSPGVAKCPVQLRAERSSAGYAFAAPPGCRHSMPALAKVVAWNLQGPGRIELRDRSGAMALDFTDNGGALIATGPRGENYELRSTRVAAAQIAAPAVAAPAKPVAPAAAAQAQPPRAPVQTSPFKPADVPGRYAILRDGDRDTGCMLTLEAGSRALLAPACRDNGIVIFDPKSWSIAGQKLVLHARKGHSAHFDHAVDGVWRKDHKEAGKPLSFRKM